MLHISFQISYEKLVLGHCNNFYLIRLSFLMACLLNNA